MVVVVIGAGLVTLGAIGRSREVSRVAVPSSSMIERLARDADYADSYMATVPADLFPDTQALDRFAFQRSAVAGETSDEIIYTGGSSGLVYHVSYLRRREGVETKLYVSTTMHLCELARMLPLYDRAPGASGDRPVHDQRDDLASCSRGKASGDRQLARSRCLAKQHTTPLRPG